MATKTAKKPSRSEIAKKAWETRRENEQKRKRSEAAKKAWKTRRKKEKLLELAGSGGKRPKNG